MLLRITESYHRGPGTLIPHVPTSTYWYFHTSVLIKKLKLIGICKMTSQSKCWCNGMFRFLFLELLSIGVSN